MEKRRTPGQKEKENRKKKQQGEKRMDKTDAAGKVFPSGAACPYAKKCGGCDYQGIPYEKQLEEKQKMVRKYVGAFCKVQPIIGMEQPYHYRNKVHHSW